MKKLIKKFARLFEASMQAALKVNPMPSMYIRQWHGYFPYSE